MNKKVGQIFYFLLFFLFLALIIVGQKNIGYSGTMLMLLGLAGLLGLLWKYNRQFQ